MSISLALALASFVEVCNISNMSAISLSKNLSFSSIYGLFSIPFRAFFPSWTLCSGFLFLSFFKFVFGTCFERALDDLELPNFSLNWRSTIFCTSSLCFFCFCFVFCFLFFVCFFFCFFFLFFCFFVFYFLFFVLFLTFHTTNPVKQNDN